MTKLKLMETYGPSTAPGENRVAMNHRLAALVKDITAPRLIENEEYVPILSSCLLTASTLKGYPCTICNIELNSVEQYQSHISGAKHKNQ